MNITLIKSIRCAICLCCALQTLVHPIEPNPWGNCKTITPFAIFSWKYFFFILSHLSWCWDAVLALSVGICVRSFFQMSSQSLTWKDSQPNAKYFSSYKSNKVSFDHCTALTSLLLWWDRLGRAMANAFVGNASVVAWDPHEGEWRRRPMYEKSFGGDWDMLRKEDLTKTMFKDTIFIFICFSVVGMWVSIIIFWIVGLLW